ncbi:MAG: VCBS repeat-containing protein, partial [Maribacter sp.]|nr:VCBS repeat-containing protein [Maribacter sp.]
MPKQLWADKVLPEMGARMGIRDSAFNPYKGLSYDEYEAVLKTGLYTPSPIIQRKEWNLLKDYIIQQSPDSLVMPNVEITNKSLNAFVPKPVSIDAITRALFTYLNVDKGTGKIKLGDMKGMLSTYDFVKDTLVINGNFNRPITAYSAVNNVEYVTAVGVLNPTELASGKIFMVQNEEVSAIPEILHRPVHTVVQDLNKDGVDEIVVSEFGYLTGRLTLLKQKDSLSFDKQTLISLPGVIRVVVRDMNGDGKKDIVALVSQGDESITILYQEKDLRFRQEKVIRFSPIYGSSWFELLDFDHDGDDDIITVHGDNADKTYTPK